jgi:hypothetical protein
VEAGSLWRLTLAEEYSCGGIVTLDGDGLRIRQKVVATLILKKFNKLVQVLESM